MNTAEPLATVFLFKLPQCQKNEICQMSSGRELGNYKAISLKFVKGKLVAAFKAKSGINTLARVISAFVKGSHASLDFFQQATGDTDKKDQVHKVHCLNAKKMLQERQDVVGHVRTSLY